MDSTYSDFSLSLPTWILYLGYTLKGRRGTYDKLYLYKDQELVKEYRYYEIPSIISMEEYIKERESRLV